MEAIILDLDGTLIDSLEHHISSYLKAAKKLGIAIKPNLIRKRFGLPVEKILKECLPQLSEEKIAEFIREKGRIFKQVRKRVRKIEGADELLKRLHKKTKLAMATSSSKEDVEFFLKKFGWQGYFEVIISAEEVRKSKPEPEIYLNCCKRLRTKPSECLVIGDSIFDMIAARKAGIQAIGIAIAQHSKQKLKLAGATWVCSSLKGVRELIERLF
jgi:HAD superfamily hydrolase (TIGR01509 family)